MKKIAILTVACSVLAGCSYLGAPESYTVVDETVEPIAEPAPVAAQPTPVVAAPACGCAAVRPLPKPTCGCATGACQINPGVAGPLVVNIPAQSVCIQ